MNALRNAGRAEFDSKTAALSGWEHIPPDVRRAMALRLRFDHQRRSFAVVTLRLTASLLFALFISAPSLAQITVRGDLQHGPVRGAVAVITVPGMRLEGRSAPTLKDWPLNLDGVSVSIEGRPCPIRGYGGDSVAFLVPEDAPRSRDWRKRSRTLTLATPTGVFQTETMIYDAWPGLAQGARSEGFGDEEYLPAGIWRTGYQRIGTFVPGDPVTTCPDVPTVIQVWGAGARFAFWRGSAVRAQLHCNLRTVTVNAGVTPWVVDGVDAITFVLPPEFAGAGRCHLRVMAGALRSEARVMDIQ